MMNTTVQGWTAAFIGLAATTSVALADATLIRNARLFDGVRLIGAPELLIEEGVITRIGNGMIPEEDWVIVDADGAFLMPGLIDSHTHTFDASILEQSLIFGVTTDLDMFTAIPALNAMRATAGPTQADIFSSGTLVTAPGGHGTQFGFDIPTITDPAQAPAFVADRLAEGSDFIKIVLEDGHELGMSIPTLSPDTLTAVVDAAHDQDALAVVHIHAYEAAVTAIGANADGLVHAFFDELPDDRLTKLMSERGSFMVPTLAIIENVCGRNGGASLVEDDALAPYLGPELRGALKMSFPSAPDAPNRIYAVAQQAVRDLNKAGVPILAGTDAPNPGTTHGASLHRELELLVEAGLTPTEALTAATSAPAKAFGLEKRGRLMPGYIADLVLVEGDPTKDITDTRNIVGVWKNGVRLDRQPWRAKVAAAFDAAQAPAVHRDLVSDFEGEAPTAAFGTGWVISTDAMMGGKSTATMTLAEGGASDSKGALRVEGSIDAEAAYPWAGAMFNPGGQVFEPTNLSANDGFSFAARGDGGSVTVMVFSRSLGRIPATVSFEAGEDWAEHAFKWTDFRGINGSDIMAIIFSASKGPASFWFELDEVRMK
jgi:imidazolonepropionase-like amidohydrolase